MSNNEELEAARDYWRQILERLASGAKTHLVDRDAVIAHAAIGKFAEVIEAHGWAHLKSGYAEYLRSAPQTSPGADPHVEFILDHLRKRIEEAYNKLPGLGGLNVVTGIEPTLGVFASRRGVIMREASVVSVTSQFFLFCNVVSKAVAQTVNMDPAGWDNLDDTEAMRMKLRARPDILTYWFEVIASFSIFETVEHVPFKILPAPLSGLRMEILEALEVFAIAHEYAHHVLKHGKLQTASSDSGKDGAAWGEEFEADTLAIAVGQMVTGHQPHENVLMLSGVGMVLLLNTLRMLRDARHLLGMTEHNQGSQGTHPSATDRLNHVDQQEWLWPHLETRFRHFRSAYGNMMRIVWEEVQPLFEQIGCRGPVSVA